MKINPKKDILTDILEKRLNSKVLTITAEELFEMF
jgi:hypothetical protein